MVDAQSGELYRPLTAEKMQPLPVDQSVTQTEWNGGFDQQSTVALLERSQHYYWWPRAYRDDEQQRYVYNRGLLQQELRDEFAKAGRNAASWLTTGVLHDALGEWLGGLDDLTKALKLNPQDRDTRFVRGLTYLIIRDLDKAASDFGDLPESDQRKSGNLDLVQILRGHKENAKHLIETMNNIETNVGTVPLVLQIGPTPLSSMRSQD